MNISPPSLGSLYIEMLFNGNRVLTGTAFLVSSEKGILLITNRHNVTGRRQDDGTPIHEGCAIPNEIKIYHHEYQKKDKWIIKTQDLYTNKVDLECPVWIEHPIYKEKVDFVAILLKDLGGVNSHLYNLNSPLMKLKLCPSDYISVIGFPFGISASKAEGEYYPVWMNGFLASEPSINYKNLPLQLIDCRSRKGQSGSPVIAYRNGIVQFEGNNTVSVSDHFEFLGIYSGRVNEESDIGLVWKTSAILELINSIKCKDAIVI